jgi:hypothetical protein
MGWRSAVSALSPGWPTAPTPTPTAPRRPEARAARWATIAVLAGGLDRDYPSGNADLAAAIRANGLTISELPPGTAPTRHRFLQRKLQIYALGLLAENHV